MPAKKKLLFLLSVFVLLLIREGYPNTVQTVKNIDTTDKKTLKKLAGNSLHGADFVYTKHKTVLFFKKQYSSEHGKRYLENIMKRSAPYRKFIEAELRKENLPYELLFLPVIESGFHSKAVSKSGAVGIWQFMKNSIGGYDITVNDWVDERRDPWKTTSAALKKLKWNYEYYGNWYLALAAYNCGVGALNTAIKKAGKADYWYLCDNGWLKKETALYVPKFIAVAEILNRSEFLGIDWGEPHGHNYCKIIEVKQPVDLVLLAEELKTEPSVLLNLNPALKFNITPPDCAYRLRVPAEKADEVMALLAEKKLFIKYYRYKVKSGDTLYALSNHYGVSVDSIIRCNPGIKPSSLKIGKELIIPAMHSVSSYTGRKQNTNIQFNGFYTIKKGDTLWSIASAYNVQVETLAEKNNIKIGDILSLGKILKVPVM